MPNKGSSTYKFTRDELQQFAIAGVRDRVRDIEKELHRMQREFPSIFITDAPLVLLAPEKRTDGKSWPLVKADHTARNQKIAATWTPARRRKAAKMMKKTRAKMERAKKNDGSKVWQQMQAALLAAPDQRATSKELQQAIGTNSVGIANSAKQHDDLFKRVEQGVYTLTAKGKSSENGATA